MHKLKVDDVIVLHVKKGFEDRASFIEKQMRERDISFTYMLDGDIEDITDERLEIFFAGDMKKKSGITSCALKHLLICEKIINNKIAAALILEDDAVLFKNFVSVFNRSIDELHASPEIGDKSYFIAYENTSFKKAAKPIKGKLLYRAKSTRATAAYLINQHAAKTILKEAQTQKISLPMDWFYNRLVDQNKISIYWCEPPIVEQGSFNGLFKTSLSDKKAGALRKISFRVKKFFKYLKSIVTTDFAK